MNWLKRRIRELCEQKQQALLSGVTSEEYPSLHREYALLRRLLNEIEDHDQAVLAGEPEDDDDNG